LHSKSPIPHKKSGAPKKGSVFFGSQQVNKSTSQQVRIIGDSNYRIIELSYYRIIGISGFEGGGGMGIFGGKIFWLGEK
ncbi:MAG: hypothetical protein SOV66_01640, partial [Sodaliphilus sp.]|nr:hypothetical protein [Sodaliphilus sp.]